MAQDTFKRETIAEKAARAGLYVATWSPGDGATRYRFSTEDRGYFESSGLYTALGRAEANTWLNGYLWGMERRREYDEDIHERATA